MEEEEGWRERGRGEEGWTEASDKLICYVEAKSVVGKLKAMSSAVQRIAFISSVKLARRLWRLSRLDAVSDDI